MVESALPALERRSSSRRRACRAKNSDATARGKANSHNPDPGWDAKSNPGSGSPERPNGIDIATLSTADTAATYVVVLGRAPSMSGTAGLVRFVHLPPVQYRSRDGFGGSGYHPRPACGDQDISEPSVRHGRRSSPSTLAREQNARMPEGSQMYLEPPGHEQGDLSGGVRSRVERRIEPAESEAKGFVR